VVEEQIHTEVYLVASESLPVNHIAIDLDQRPILGEIVGFYLDPDLLRV